MPFFPSGGGVKGEGRAGEAGGGGRRGVLEVHG